MIVQRIVTYLFPQASKASELKLIQEKTSQIRAIRFNRETLKLAERLEGATNPGLYFLFEPNPGTEDKVSVGQTINGIIKIKNDLSEMDEATKCILFVMDNNSFDKNSLDALEYLFAHKLEKSQYEFVKKNFGNTVPGTSIYEQPYVYTCISQIEFLLSAEGVLLYEVDKHRPTVQTNNQRNHVRYYFPKESKYDAKIFIENNRYYIVSGSFIRRPLMNTHNNKSGDIYNRNNKVIDSLLEQGKIVVFDDGFKILCDVPFKSSSLVASLISGLSVNGKDFF